MAEESEDKRKFRINVFEVIDRKRTDARNDLTRAREALDYARTEVATAEAVVESVNALIMSIENDTGESVPSEIPF